MALSKSVEESLKEAESVLRNALSYAARQERAFVCGGISDMITKIDSLIHADTLMDKLENRKFGDKGSWDAFFTDNP